MRTNRLGFTCWHPATNAMTNNLPDYGGQAVNNQRLICPVGEIGAGIYGRAGTAIDQLGLICEKTNIVGPPPPPQPTPSANTRPSITVSLAQSRTFLVHGSGFLPNRQVAIRVADDFSNPNLWYNTISTPIAVRDMRTDQRTIIAPQKAAPFTAGHAFHNCRSANLGSPRSAPGQRANAASGTSA